MSSRVKLILLVALSVGCAAGGGAIWGTVATAAVGNGTVKVCVETKTNIVVPMSSKGKCPKGSKLTTLSQISPQGPAGLVGREGPAGPAGQTGESGKNGTNGQDGKDGKDGQDGKDGKNVVSEVIDGGKP